MFERYTESARRTIFFARYEASQFGSQYIETEHLLLGLLRQDKPLATRFLGSNKDLGDIRKRIEAWSTMQERVPTSVDMPLSQECKRALDLSVEESERLNHTHIGTEHLLLGMLRLDKGHVADLLASLGLKLNQVRESLANRPHPVELPAGSVAPSSHISFTASAEEILKKATEYAEKSGEGRLDDRHLLLAMLAAEDSPAGAMLRARGIRPEDVPPPPPDPARS